MNIQEIKHTLAQMRVINVQLVKMPEGTSIQVYDANARSREEITDVTFGAHAVFINHPPRWVQLIDAHDHKLAQEVYELALANYEANKALTFKDLQPGEKFRFIRDGEVFASGEFTVIQIDGVSGRTRALGSDHAAIVPGRDMRVVRVEAPEQLRFKDLALGEYFRFGGGLNAQFMVVHKNGGRCARAADLTTTYPSPRSLVIRTSPQLVFSDLKPGDRFRFSGEYDKEFTVVSLGKRNRVLGSQHVAWNTSGKRAVIRIEKTA